MLGQKGCRSYKHHHRPSTCKMTCHLFECKNWWGIKGGLFTKLMAYWRTFAYAINLLPYIISRSNCSILLWVATVYIIYSTSIYYGFAIVEANHTPRRWFCFPLWYRNNDNNVRPNFINTSPSCFAGEHHFSSKFSLFPDDRWLFHIKTDLDFGHPHVFWLLHAPC